MATAYTETPSNLSEIMPFIVTDIKVIKNLFYSADRVIFYDVCSFQRHSHLANRERSILIRYYNAHATTVFITRCILMELASDRGMLAEEFIEFIKVMSENEIKVVLFDEEYIYDILSECFSVNEKINAYLLWAVRMCKSPTSTITETLKENIKLMAEVLEGKNLQQSDVYDRFFTAVRGNKEHDDNLGEELIAICVHILSHLPGVYDGKLCVMTDDKGAAAKIDSVMKKTDVRNRGVKIVLFSTPKLVQHMFQEQVEISEDEMVTILSQGASGKIVVMGITAYDFDVNRSISMTSRELAHKIMEPNGILIVF